MKKVIAIVLSIVMLIGCAPLASAAKDDLKLIFATDVHFSFKDSTNPITKSTDENPFGHTVSNGKLTAESAAILDQFFKEAAASDAQYVILTGDISDNGEIENVKGIVEKLEAFEQSSGKTVIASMGNHETYHVSPTGTYISGGLTGPDFREYYKNLGPDIALDVDENSASYTVDLNSKYRLICIDANNMNDALYNWIEAQALKAKDDGKYLISVTHFSLFAHYQFEKLAGGSIIDEKYNLADKFIEWGIKFNFSGHTHELDCASYTNDQGIVYDTTCGALTTYPANYKTATFGKNSVTINTNYINKVDMSLVPEGLAKEAYDLMSNDFRAYARKMFTEGAKSEISVYINWSYIVGMAKLDYTRDAEIIDLLKVLIPRVNEAINMPLYGEGSIEEIANKVGYELPKLGYNTLFEAICEVYCLHCQGNEYTSAYTPLGKLLLNGIAAALTYALDALSVEDFQLVINWALDTFDLGIDIPQEIRDLAANALYRYDVIEYIVLNVASPLIDDFLTDAGPNDEIGVFPGYEINEAPAVSFLDRIRAFLNTIRLIVNTILEFFDR